MSTKSTIAYSHDPKFDFHLYNECMEDDSVYLEIKDQTLRIPLVVWEAIRAFPGGSFDLAGKSTADVRKDVEAYVDERIADVKEAKKIKDKKDRQGRLAWINFCGGLPFGMATDSRENQVKSGMKEYLRRRRFQLKVLAAAAKIKSEQTKGPYLINLGTGETKALGEEK